LTILLHLRFQLLDGFEALNVPQTLHPFDPDPLTVQIAAEVEEVSFECAPSILECGTGPLAHHAFRAALPPLDGHGIHSIGRQELTRRHPGQIDRRHAESTAATLSFAEGIKAEEGDVFEIEVAEFGLPLRNPLKIAAEEEIAVKQL